ncbi:Sulfite reductase [NADPH] flavoprotein alpha-component [Lacunisphaera limnophila]|uniref:assimilatory sulfite reductase (NADPH) n=1 Tax=Lacunisphaera limnophila TaxID=1838286 RepID=A0A1D8AZ49_9BACT|nr:sulfite reductase subunit alpha [Lacunisphaera limnophila]AOS46173.1 Sulfite reductase [NADPH] flavoprotein alpha-component [Lacunisphaera limnophila]
MNPAPLIPDTAPFTPEQRAWLNGFLAGVFSRSAVASPVGASSLATPALAPLTILFGTQTGTAETLAKKAAKEAGKRGFAPIIFDLAQTDLAKLAQEKNVLIITSTYGDGEPPDTVKALHTALKSEISNLKSPMCTALSAVRYSVCALGDTNYAQFCQCGKDLDTWLGQLGATRTTPRTDCDLDYDAPFTAWLDQALAALGSAPVGASSLATGSPEVTTKVAPTHEEITYTKQNPFPASVLTVRHLNGPGSGKEVNHVEFSLAGSGLTYEAGDALGVLPQNCPQLVADILSLLGCDGEEAVPTPGGELPLRRALTECYDLGKPTPELLALLAGVPVTGAGAPPPRETSAPHHVIDVLLAAPAKPVPADFIAKLKKLQPRLYSISSSPRAHPGQVHLTVGAVRYDRDGRPRKGVCSTFLAERGLAAGKVGVFVHANKSFRPPAAPDLPMIMVGPGTGIAPFRAFLEERRATGAKGRNWLFFGDQKASADFLYREELLGLQESGVLTRLDLAFSRDQAEKIYVQHRMLENAAELYAWLEAGAHFYVCGDASRMAKDVDLALHQVIEKAAGKSPDQAAAYVQALKSAKRYQRDVY